MPFTGSHPAAILPLLGLRLPASALVIGSMIPDLRYFVPLPVSFAATHSLAGAVGIDVIVGIPVLLLWHLLLVPPLVWAAPEGLQRRIPEHLRGGLPSELLTLGGWARVYLALAAGALTHVVWDAFTHTGGWGSRALALPAAPILGLPLPRWLHLASSIGGLALLGWFLVRWWRRTPPAAPSEPIRAELRWGLAGFLVALATHAALRVAIEHVSAYGRVGRQMLVIHSLVEFLSTLGLGVILACAAWHVVRAVRRGRVPTG